MQAMEISRSGLDVEWRRLEIIADNLANAGSTHTAAGGPYQALRLVSGPRGGVFSNLLKAGDTGPPRGVAVYGVEPTGAPPRRVLEPSNPDADAEGYVTYPGVDHAQEMTLMVKTARVYEANLVAFNAARQMYAKAMELGRR